MYDAINLKEVWYSRWKKTDIFFIKRAGLTHVMVLNLSHYKNLMFHLAKKKLESEFDEPRYFEI